MVPALLTMMSTPCSARHVGDGPVEGRPEGLRVSRRPERGADRKRGATSGRDGADRLLRGELITSVVHAHQRAVAGEALSDRAPDAATRASHQRRLAVQWSHTLLLCEVIATERS
jgi:hypothetical protein